MGIPCTLSQISMVQALVRISTQNLDYNPDILFYIELLPFAMGNAALAIILVIAGGLTLSWIRLIRGKKKLDSYKRESKNRI